MYDYEGLDEFISEIYYDYITEEDVYSWTEFMTDQDKMDLVVFLIKSIKFGKEN